jgi:hypothetical protein
MRADRNYAAGNPRRRRCRYSSRATLSFAKTLRATEFHFLTMLQTCSQGVDLKADRDFGEGQGCSAKAVL